MKEVVRYKITSSLSLVPEYHYYGRNMLWGGRGLGILNNAVLRWTGPIPTTWELRVTLGIVYLPLDRCIEG